MNKIYLLFICILTACSSPVDKVTKSKNTAIQKVIAHNDAHEVQILYTQIDSTKEGAFTFKDYSYHLDNSNYFYPGTMVMLPMAVFASEYIATIPDITIDTPYAISNDSLKNSVANDIALMLQHNDRKAFNRLYDLVGQEFIDSRFRESGLIPARISHKLGSVNDSTSTKKEFIFFPNYTEDPIRLLEGERSAIAPLTLNNTSKGTSYMNGSEITQKPMDFRTMNYLPLESQHTLFKRLLVNNSPDSIGKFNLEKGIQERIVALLQQPLHEDATTEDDKRNTQTVINGLDSLHTATAKIYHMRGSGYGTMTASTYVKDLANNVHFIVSATVLVNENGVYGDDMYEYDTVGHPFLDELVKELYQIASARE